MSQTNPSKILLVDDSELIHRLLRARLQNERFELHSATSSVDGLLSAKTIKPEVILLDIDMPKMDGFEFITRLKTDPETKDIPVIFVSAANESGNRVRGLDHGAVDFIAKPFDIVELKARLRSVLRIQNLISMLADKAQIDGLSGLRNKTYFDNRLQAEFAEADRHKSPLSLVIADIDCFKKTNDNHGHLFGNDVIERFSNILNGGRLSDIACRWGGEEFAIILPRTTMAEAFDVTERYRIQLTNIVWPEHPALVITASFGVCDIENSELPPTPKTLFLSAEKAMYTAKNGGRNRVECFQNKTIDVRK